MDQSYGPFRSKFHYIVLICPTFAHNKTYHRIGENDPGMFVIICAQHGVGNWLKLVSRFFEGTNTLVILSDCTASKDVVYRFDPNTPWVYFRGSAPLASSVEIGRRKISPKLKKVYVKKQSKISARKTDLIKI